MKYASLFFLVNSGPLMLSMQYSNNNLSQQHQYSSHQHGLRSRYNLKHNSSNHHKRNRRLSGTFIPEHHLITVPPSQTTKNVSPTYIQPSKNVCAKEEWFRETPLNLSKSRICGLFIKNPKKRSHVSNTDYGHPVKAWIKNIWKIGPMWQTKYVSALPKNLGLGLNFQPCSEG